MTVGQELAAARRRLGLSLEDVSSTTGVAVEQLRAIEDTELTWPQSSTDVQFAIRAYASAVELDAEDVVHRYAAQLPIVPTAEQSLAAFESEGSEPARPAPARLFAFESVDGEPLSVRSLDRPIATPLDETLLRYAPPDPLERPERPIESGRPIVANLPSARFPIAALVIASAVAVTGGFLLSANRDAGGRQPAAAIATDAMPPGDAKVTRADQRDAAVAETADRTTAATPRPTPAPPAHPAPPAPEVASTAARSTLPAPSQVAAGAPVAADRQSGRQRAATRSVAPRSEDPAPRAFIVVPGSSSDVAPEAATKLLTGELSGAWNVLTQAESQTEAPESGAAPTYRFQLEQRGARIVGSAYRVSDGVKGPPANVSGTFTGGRLTLDVTGEDRARLILYRGGGDTFLGRVRRGTESSGGSAIVKLERASAPSAR
jgi:hypothetical protein